jgi:hypothetical protein
VPTKALPWGRMRDRDSGLDTDHGFGIRDSGSGIRDQGFGIRD